MKIIIKIILLALTVYSSAYPQITEIAKLPAQNAYQTITPIQNFFVKKCY